MSGAAVAIGVGGSSPGRSPACRNPNSRLLTSSYAGSNGSRSAPGSGDDVTGGGAGNGPWSGTASAVTAVMTWPVLGVDVGC